ncbi:MAG: ABC transporter permease [Thermoplasmata archaeon]|jgi:peptide/nickel transport system permease protein|uniref:ABC transporter permease n=1 Tax=Caldisericum sp. TaxID=2499687 RepID=UPI001A0B7A2F|nr:ABC transporter permease [Thermoplasmatales archaeon]
MSTFKFVGKRLAYSIISLIGLSVLVFVLARVLPGNPARAALGPNAPPEAVQALMQQLHLNEPLYIQYWYWISGIFTGNWGLSLYTHRNVLLDVEQFFPATLELIIMAGIIDLLLAIPLGLLAGKMENTYVDNIIRVLTYIGIAIPSFVVAIFLQLIFGYGLHLFPIIGELSPGVTPPPRITGLYVIDGLLTGEFNVVVDAIWHLILPSFSLALGPLAQEARILRSAVVENKNSDFTLSEISHGLPDSIITTKYLLKPSLIPMITIYALDISSIIANAFLIEFIFNWPGISRYGLNAMLSKDLNGIIAVVMIAGVLFVIANTLVDVIVGYLDPRSREEVSD